MSVRLVRAVAVMLAAMLALSLLAGCGSPGQVASSGKVAPRSEDLTPGEFPDDAPPAAQAPPPPMLRTPQTAVYSYLLWITYAYRTLNSDVATHAFSQYEEVRVSSYVQLNKQEGRAIDQRLIDLKERSVSTQGATSTVAATEVWRYRYIKVPEGTYRGPAYDVTYDSTYTVVNYPDKGWLVDKVEATPVGDAPE